MIALVRAWRSRTGEALDERPSESARLPEAGGHAAREPDCPALDPAAACRWRSEECHHRGLRCLVGLQYLAIRVSTPDDAEPGAPCQAGHRLSQALCGRQLYHARHGLS